MSFVDWVMRTDRRDSAAAGRGRRVRAWARVLAPAWLVAAMGGALAGCVVEEVRPVSPFEATAGTGSNRGAFEARPIRTRTTVGSIALLPLGRLRYDGMTLPLTSPDGRWIVAQEGDAPEWSAVLAEPGGGVPSGSTRRLRVHEVREDRLVPSAVLEHLPLGTMLGRSCNDEGFLVERPMEDGSRWIGFVRWDAGAAGGTPAIEWLVADEHVNAHATLGPTAGGGAELAWSRKRLGQDRFELVVRPMMRSRRGEARLAPEGSHAMFPLFGGSGCDGRPPSVWCVVAPAGAKTEKSAGSAIEIAEVAWGSGRAAIEQRLPIGPFAGAASAFEAVASSQTPAACSACAGVVVYSSGAGSMVYVPASGRRAVVLDAGATAGIARMGLGGTNPSIAGCVPSSALVSNPNGLVEVALGTAVEMLEEANGVPRTGEAESGRVSGLAPPPVGARGMNLIPGSFVPRGTRAADGRVILLAPPLKGEDFVLEVLLAVRPKVGE